jgi:uncharacterized membrane protein
MKQNEGTVDRIVRVVAGIALIAAGFFAVTGTIGIIMIIVGAILLLTGAIGFCPLYALFKISTLRQS